MSSNPATSIQGYDKKSKLDVTSNKDIIRCQYDQHTRVQYHHIMIGGPWAMWYCIRYGLDHVYNKGRAFRFISYYFL